MLDYGKITVNVIGSMLTIYRAHTVQFWYLYTYISHDLRIL